MKSDGLEKVFFHITAIVNRVVCCESVKCTNVPLTALRLLVRHTNNLPFIV